MTSRAVVSCDLNKTKFCIHADSSTLTISNEDAYQIYKSLEHLFKEELTYDHLLQRLTLTPRHRRDFRATRLSVV
jgi:hypothetical protein